MWFLSGSLALIVLNVALQQGSADKATSGAGVLVGGMRRLLASDVAGVPAKAKPAPAKTQAQVTPAAPAPITAPMPQLPGTFIV